MFLCRLGLALSKTVDEILNLPVDELEMWKAFYRVEPFGQPIAIEIADGIVRNLLSPHLKKGKTLASGSIFSLPSTKKQRVQAGLNTLFEVFSNG